MKSLLSFTLALVGATLSLHASPPTDLSITDMMNAMQVDKMVTQIALQMDSGMKAGLEQGVAQALAGKEPSPAQRLKIDEARSKLSAMVKEELSFEKTKDIYLQVYKDTFSQEEVNSIIAFYASPAGKSMVQKLPDAMQKGGTLMQQRLAPTMQRMQGMMQDVVKDVASNP